MITHANSQFGLISSCISFFKGKIPQCLLLMSYIPCACSFVRFSSVSRTASLCPRASHLDLAVVQLTFTSCRVKLTDDSAVKYTAKNREENIKERRVSLFPFCD